MSEIEDLRAQLANLPLAERFWRRVDKSGGEAACWRWLGGATRGYGCICVNGRNRRATHVSLELHGRALPKGGEVVCHVCDNPPCVNPAHLFVGTMSDNIRDAHDKGRVRTPTERGLEPWQRRREYCKRGHRLTPDGARPGRRICETCRAARERARRAAERDRTRVRQIARAALAEVGK